MRSKKEFEPCDDHRVMAATEWDTKTLFQTFWMKFILFF